MKILDRYLFRTVATATAVALLVLLLLELFLSLLVELEDVGKGHYDFVAVMRYLLLIQPQRLYEMFPMALLVGGLLGMGALASGSELIAMRAAGLSLMRLTGSALQAGLLLSLVVLAIGEFVAPPLEQAAREQRAVAKTENLAIRGGRGFWARDGDYFIHVRAVLPGVRLVDIHIFKINPGSAQLETLTAAQGARYVEGHWLLEEVNRSSLNGDEVQTEHLAQLSVVSAISPQILDVLAANPDELSIRDLRIYVTYLEGNGLDAQNYRLALWRKLLAPLAYMAMLVVAMPFVFGPSRSSGAGQRIVIGLLLGLLFFLFNYLLGNVVLLYGLPPLVGAGLPTLLFLGAGGYALRRLR
ncbi:MAG: LPS export ABC transporter permease LptG [Candidatus Competibacteraceae bacterium]|uniref:Lipopolysaccharide export system permease protein lptG n=1 Tax=Candidatus Contendobacter odensis Run_B_J11 TaxID=1400861 RepID=A0A7U7J1U3_9GAMM|nr:LPS export ABC transporter permease LptG [Candidatus Contendobacter odensis]MBK8535041.1 LPS export ABC transporter permease LptG [Candidatus Competibacteraceae bacterium]MBK8753314.1 LPS export ABC transporter permease LptG [Candidatus Competibacteraceae bacterium]CDH43236.1 putative Lipopolysaccharide export system permease protein lptG [Candidatus Contendobacter odensis Run_B_J11]